MNKKIAENLELHFDTAFAAPDGIKKLRELILTLAVQGKLVPQDPRDPPASELLKEIAAEKKRFIQAGKIRILRETKKIRRELTPLCSLPSGWKLMKLTEIGYFLGGKTPSKNKPSYWEGNIPWVSPKDMKKLFIDESEDHVTEEGLKSGLPLIPEKSILMVVRSGILRRKFPVAINNVQCTINQDLKALVPFLASCCDYLFLMFRGFENFVLSNLTKKGVTVESVTFDEFAATFFPVPPLPEQHRIVAKIDQLMARCDELEKLRTEREQKRRSVHTAVLKQLLDAQERGSFADAWRFITQHFGELYAVKENVTELRKAILQLAVMGKLVPQDPNDPPAGELLKEIDAEKKRLLKEGKIKAIKPLLAIKTEEIPYQLPKGWEWVRFGDITSTRLGKMLDKSKNRGAPKPYLRNTNVQWHSFELDDVKEMKFEDGELEEFRVMPGDLLICEGGEPGRCAIWNHPSKEIYFQKAIHRARPFNGIAVEYLQICLTNDARNGSLSQYFTGATIKHFPGDKLSRYLFAIPPSNEQHRIVTKINQLMSLCGTLEQHIDVAAAKQTNLLNAVMNQRINHLAEISMELV